MPQARRSVTREIKRETLSAWWCPFDDHSNMQLLDTCGGCGAVRDGDKVKAPPQFQSDDEAA
jgi:hypothetical protein